ncbi:MAG TPA: alkaline phosphatase D family protein [Actinophytocola sp.]|uniref:alkaline phosphatase D family protein n=1 Tax=Actinophytocola sp. TaxID=1872138 RepID=UPI002DB6C563|nr:alkaline phosphatase D family protein [Actinophytocola sp.]HEU5469160.1 alkaline phosphatase D family protein [Actinophytocola sp.]
MVSSSASAIARRNVLLGGTAAVGLTALGTPLAGAAPAVRPLTDPFTLGVASGDPLPDSVVLWTRLAPAPLNDDGLGGMPSRAFPVLWQVSENERFTRVVRSGVALADPRLAHSVHVEAGGLRPGREYFYRFRVRGHLSPVGRTRTAPAHGTFGSGLTMCFASCSHFGEGFFTAYRRLAEEHPDLVLHLGDYQYEYETKAADVRVVAGPETRTLAGYRQRHAQYKTDPDLQLAHATAPWLVVWDDHETENNWADEVPEQPDPGFSDRRAAAFQAYYENMPLRSSARPRGIDMRLYRRFAWGGLATFHMLDTRQYRDDQACGDGTRVNCAERLDPARTITGAEQERWLADGLARSRARWDVLGQQVFFAQRDLRAGVDQGFSMDAWDGYRASRDRVAAMLGGTRNGVVLTGDVHRHYAADLKANPDQPDSPGVGVELVATSITSGGDGDEGTNPTVRTENPHIKFYKNRRGYVRTRFTPTELRADFQILPAVRTPDAPSSTAASFTVADRDPTLHQT